MKNLNLIAFTLLIVACFSVRAQDTVSVQSLVYASQTRDTIVSFPDGSDSYEKILMKYSMRCKGARISTGSNRNLGCGEWDYSCNTYIVDSSRIDSLLTTTAEYRISNFSEDEFSYSSDPIYDLYRKYNITTTVSESSNITEARIGLESNTLTQAVPIPGNPEGPLSGTSVFMYTASELAASGLAAGEIDAIKLFSQTTLDVSTLKIDFKHSTADSLDANASLLSDWENVFSNDVAFAVGENNLQFHQPFTWDGTSNVLVRYTRDQKTLSQQLALESSISDTTRGLSAYGGRSVYLDGSTYLESNTYEGVLGNANRTMSAWIKTTQVNGEIISYGNNATGQKWVFRINDNGKLRVEINGGFIVGTTDLNEGKWHHVACVLNGNAVSDITLYVDGNAEANTELSSIAVNTAANIKVRVSLGINNRQFLGNVDDVKIWDRALSSTEIADDVRNAANTQDLSLQLYYSFNTLTPSASNILDLSGNGRDASTFENLNTSGFRGYENFKNFTKLGLRPNTVFVSGDFTQTSDTVSVTDSVAQIPNIVEQYEVVSNSNTIFSDELNAVSKQEYWNATNKINTYGPDGEIIEIQDAVSQGTLSAGTLQYFRRWPSRLEIMSFVTPYGIGLDLGPDGKTWTFDVTHFTPILKGNKRMFLSRGGQNQEEMDIEFLFVKGTPAREVLSIDQIWPTEQYQPNYTQIQQNTTIFPPVTYPISSEVKGVSVRSAITGHGQDGEFRPRNHTITADDTTFTRSVWKACANNPIYPQGGTWIYDRAGWCPGMATDVAEYDITSRALDGGEVTLDYNVESGSGDSRYIVNNQIVLYGDYNFELEAGIEDILEPSTKVEYARDNPMCINPKMLIRNNGSELITSITIDYWVNDKANKSTFTWPCHLFSNGVEKIYFPIDNRVWSSTNTDNPVFSAEIVALNGQEDQYPANNVYHSTFEIPELYPPKIVLFYRTNAAASENTISVKNEWGRVLFERNDLQPNTLYRDSLTLGLGCKQLEITDSDGDGISFWANSDGSGFFRIMAQGGGILNIIEPDFGGGTIVNFTVLHALNVPEKELELGYKAYPNPTNGNITISGGDLKDVDCEVINGLGQIVNCPQDNTGDRLTLNLSAQVSGVYFVKLVKNGAVWTEKIILQ